MAVQGATNEKLMGAVAYLGWWVTGIIILLVEKKNQYVRFHAMQAVLVFGAISLLFIVLGIISTLFYIPGGIQNGILVCIIVLLLFLCGISDDLDGYMARKYNMKTTLGKHLDFWVDFFTFCSIIVSIYFLTKKEVFLKVIIPIICLWGLYKKIEKRYKIRGKKISDVLNIITHIFSLYLLIIILYIFL